MPEPQNTTAPEPEPTATPKPAPKLLRKNGPLAVLEAGRQAFREVPGLRWFLFKGFVLLYGVTLVVGAVMLYLVFYLILDPLTGGADPTRDAGWWSDWIAPVVDLLILFTKWLLMAGTLILGFLISLAMMSVWFEALAGRIVNHLRGGQVREAPFSLGLMIRSIGRSLKDSLLLILLTVFGLLLGFIPLVGPFLLLGITSYILGREAREPYLMVRESLGDDRRNLRKGLWWWTLTLGMIPVLLAMVPVIGWFFLPLTLIYLVAGVAWKGELALRETGESSPAP